MARQGTSGRGDPQLWGGTAFIVGIVTLILGLGYWILGNTTMGEIFLLGGAALLAVGFAVARLAR